MIAVAIMAIISAIALPTYQNYIQSTYFNQAVLDAKACTLAVERFYTNNFTYVGSGSACKGWGECVASHFFRIKALDQR